MRHVPGCLMIWMLGAGSICAGADLNQFRHWKPLEWEPAQHEEILAFEVDSDIYARTRMNLPDVRVSDDADAEVPYQVERQIEQLDETVRKTSTGEALSLREEENAIEIRTQLPKKAMPADGITFSTPLKDFERRIDIAGSSDGKQWTPLVTAATIFDYSRFMDVRNHEVALPPNKYRHFKILVQEVTDEKESAYMQLARTFEDGDESQRVEQTSITRRPLRIDRITFWHEVSRARVRRPKQTEFSIVRFRTEEDEQQQQTCIYVETRREPLTSFTLETTSRNFSRDAVVQVAEEKGGTIVWNQIGRARIFNFQFREFHREKLRVTFPEERQLEYRIVIRNEDNPPLPISRVQAQGNAYQVVFLAQPEKIYRVFYGSQAAQHPKYETATVLANLTEGYQPVKATLGAQADNATFGGAAETSWWELFSSPLLLILAVSVMVVVLGWGLFQASRHLESYSDTDEPSK